MEREILFRYALDNTLVRPRVREVRPTGNCVRGKSPKTSVGIGEIDCASLGVHVFRQEGEDVFRQLVESLLALDPLAQVDLAGANPGLALLCTVLSGRT